VVGALVVPVGDVQRPVRTHQAVDRPEPRVVGDQEVAAVVGRETRTFRLQYVPVEGIRQQVAGDVLVVELFGEGATAVEDAATGDVAALEVLVRYVLEIAV